MGHQFVIVHESNYLKSITIPIGVKKKKKNLRRVDLLILNISSSYEKIYGVLHHFREN